MLRRYTLILNLFLIVVCFIFAGKVHQIWTSDEYLDVADLSVERAESQAPSRTARKAKRALRREYNVIVEKDLFRPERTEWESPVDEVQTGTGTAPAKQFLVYGIVIADDFKQAWILEEGKRENPKKVSEGETFDGWKVSEIDLNAVTLSRGDEIVTYQLIEPGKPKQRVVPRAITKKAPKPRRGAAARPQRPRTRPTSPRRPATTRPQ